MESTLSLQSNLYPRITPAGAYYAVTNDTPSASRTLLYSLLRANPSEVISSEKILAWADTSDINTALNLLYRLQRLEFLYGDKNISNEDIHLTDEQLPELLEQLSNSGKALLADENGLYFANANFHHEAAEELGLLASEVAKMEDDHRLLIVRRSRPVQGLWQPWRRWRRGLRRRWPDARSALCRSEERRVGKECRSRWSPYH